MIKVTKPIEADNFSLCAGVQILILGRFPVSKITNQSL